MASQRSRGSAKSMQEKREIGYAAAALALRERRGQDECPEPEDLACLFERTLPEAQAEEIRSHVVRCDTCSEEFAMLAEMDFVPRESAERPPESPGSGLLAWVQDTLGAVALRPTVGWLAIPVAAIALVAVLVNPAYDPSIPSYSLVVRSELLYRGTSEQPESTIRLRDGGDVQILLRPAVAVSGDLVRMSVYASIESGVLVAVDTDPEYSEDGVVILEATLGDDLEFPPQTEQLYIAVAKHRSMPTARQLLEALRDSQEAHTGSFSAWRLTIDSSAPE